MLPVPLVADAAWVVDDDLYTVHDSRTLTATSLVSGARRWEVRLPEAPYGWAPLGSLAGHLVVDGTPSRWVSRDTGALLAEVDRGTFGRCKVEEAEGASLLTCHDGYRFLDGPRGVGRVTPKVWGRLSLPGDEPDHGGYYGPDGRLLGRSGAVGVAWGEAAGGDGTALWGVDLVAGRDAWSVPTPGARDAQKTGDICWWWSPDRLSAHACATGALWWFRPVAEVRSVDALEAGLLVVTAGGAALLDWQGGRERWATALADGVTGAAAGHLGWIAGGPATVDLLAPPPASGGTVRLRDGEALHGVVGGYVRVAEAGSVALLDATGRVISTHRVHNGTRYHEVAADRSTVVVTLYGDTYVLDRVSNRLVVALKGQYRPLAFRPDAVVLHRRSVGLEPGEVRTVARVAPG